MALNANTKRLKTFRERPNLRGYYSKQSIQSATLPTRQLHSCYSKKMAHLSPIENIVSSFTGNTERGLAL
ncbi:MAG TPA: hypothetical protein V6D19_11085 [Stenomitos sp.]